ncbi:hypothetical protein [Marinobacterium stanieri]|nr:hypothetical protein [Marinobacterium stanieri]
MMLPSRTDPCQTAEERYALPVKVDASGCVWSGGSELPCPLDLPLGKRGFLLFEPQHAVLLLGPWGPDPRSNLLLSARVSHAEPQGLLHLWLGAGLPELVLERRPEAQSILSARTGQKVWLAVSSQALAFSL